MTIRIIEPRDPFIARDGRPFNAGDRAASLQFPFPSTTTGGVRTRAGIENGAFDPSLIPRILNIEVSGHLLVALNDEDQIAEWFAPAPADALLFEIEVKETKDGKEETRTLKDKALLRQLAPHKFPKGALTNLPDPTLLPVYLSTEDGKPEKRKPFGAAPRFWRWS